MSLTPRVGKLGLFSVACFTLGNWIWPWMSSLPRLISRPPVRDVETMLSSATWVLPARGMLKSASGSITGNMELLDDGTTLKGLYLGCDIENNVIDIAKEASIYRRIGPHKRLVQMLCHCREGLVLEYMKNGDLKTYLQAHDSISTSLRLKWVYEVAEAVDLLHRNGIIHCDIKPRNFLLDTMFEIKIIDFSGSSLDGSKPTSATDLFVLGSTLYEFTQGTSPYEEVPSDEAEGLFTQKEFPDISDTLSGIVIKQFWLSQIESAADVQNSTRTIIFRTANVDCIPHPDDPGTAQDMLIDPLIPP